MALSKERIGEIAWAVLLAKNSKSGFMLKPKEVKREITNMAKKLGIPFQEAADFARLLIEKICAETLAELGTIGTHGKDKE